MTQNAVVFLIVACAAWAVAGRYLPASVRRLAWERVSAAAHRHGWTRIAMHADAKQTNFSSSCGSGCGSCKGCGTAAQPPSSVQIVVMPEPMRKNPAK